VNQCLIPCERLSFLSHSAKQFPVLRCARRFIQTPTLIGCWLLKIRDRFYCFPLLRLAAISTETRL
jgi:hypothetical protein